MDRGIEYYRSIAAELPAEDRSSFNEKLNHYEDKLAALKIRESATFNYSTVTPPIGVDSSLPL